VPFQTNAKGGATKETSGTGRGRESGQGVIFTVGESRTAERGKCIFAATGEEALWRRVGTETLEKTYCQEQNGSRRTKRSGVRHRGGGKEGGKKPPGCPSWVRTVRSIGPGARARKEVSGRTPRWKGLEHCAQLSTEETNVPPDWQS